MKDHIQPLMTVFRTVTSKPGVPRFRTSQKLHLNYQYVRARALRKEKTRLMENTAIAIIGAGPYGLSAAAHLGQQNGVDLRLFGEPVSFWERHMPSPMLLRSPW